MLEQIRQRQSEFLAILQMLRNGDLASDLPDGLRFTVTSTQVPNEHGCEQTGFSTTATLRRIWRADVLGGLTNLCVIAVLDSGTSPLHAL